MEESDREWVRSEVAGVSAALADVEQRLRKRVHDAAEQTNKVVSEHALALHEIETWRQVHMMESTLRGTGLLERFDRTDAHLAAQDKSISALTATVTRWAGGLAALVAAVGVVIAVIELVKK